MSKGRRRRKGKSTPKARACVNRKMHKMRRERKKHSQKIAIALNYCRSKGFRSLGRKRR